MAKKDYYLLVDTESTLADKAADFGAVVVDRSGTIHKECSVLIRDIFYSDDKLYHAMGDTSIFGYDKLQSRYDNYREMIENGRRMLASVPAVNRWLARVMQTYNPVLTAYNLKFDARICANTGIDLELFQRRFCLWYASAHHWGHSRKYRKFCLEQHAFGSRSKTGCITYKTTADYMARFLVGPNLPPEPHLAMEDIIGYELPILVKLLKIKSKKELLDEVKEYDYTKYQLRDWYKVR